MIYVLLLLKMQIYMLGDDDDYGSMTDYLQRKCNENS